MKRIVLRWYRVETRRRLPEESWRRVYQSETGIAIANPQVIWEGKWKCSNVHELERTGADVERVKEKK